MQSRPLARGSGSLAACCVICVICGLLLRVR
jgi:hypothetical protein